jgi:hypothetical protein
MARAPAATSKADRALTAVAALCGTIFAWVLSGPRYLAMINWDNGAYISAIARGELGWSAVPWNSHLGVGQAYLIGTWLSHPFGGSVIDGFRLTSAIYFAWACALVFDTTRRLTGSRALGGALTLAWATAWVNLHYHLILEDNFLFLAPAAAVLRICVLHARAFDRRAALTAGALGFVAYLGSVQALPYLAPAVYASWLCSRGRPLGRRVGEAAWVLGGFFAALWVWVILFAATSQVGFWRLVGTVFSRPNPSFFPHTLSELGRDLSLVFDTLGTGFAYHLYHSAYDLPPTALSMVALGLIAALLQVAIFATATWASRRTGDPVPHLLSASMLLFSFVTSLHKDLASYAELKRFDFMPLMLVLSAAWLHGHLRERVGPRLIDRIVLGGLALLCVVQTSLGLAWDRNRLAGYPTGVAWNVVPHPRAAQYGREGQSFYAYFRGVREATPDACRHVFSLAELFDGLWNFDIPGALWSELPDHVAVASRAQLKSWKADRWRYPPRLMSSEDLQVLPLPACAWRSAAAQQLIGP